MHLPACGKCRCWLSCCLAAFAVWCFSFQLRLCIFGGWSDCYRQIQVMELIRHSRQVQFTGPSLSFGSESPLGSSSFHSGPTYTSSVNLTSVPQLIVCSGAGCWACRWGKGSTVFTMVGTGSDCAAQKPGLILKAGADLSATQLGELALVDSVGQFCCLK